jgi:hypothetical protein
MNVVNLALWHLRRDVMNDSYNLTEADFNAILESAKKERHTVAVTLKFEMDAEMEVEAVTDGTGQVLTITKATWADDQDVTPEEQERLRLKTLVEEKMVDDAVAAEEQKVEQGR